jgi:Tfp pilus assembly protein PilN
MIEINLLPKEYQKRRFKVALEKNTLYVAAAGVAVLLLLAAYTVLFQVIPDKSINKKILSYQNEAANFAPQIAKIDSLNNLKQRILTRMSAIELLDHGRSTWINILGDLGSRVSDYLWVTEFKQLVVEVAPPKPQVMVEGEGNPDQPKKVVPQVAAPKAEQLKKATLKGKSFSLNSIATLIVRLKKSPYFGNIELTSIKLVEERNAEAYEFTINSNLYLNRTEQQSTEKAVIAGNESAGAQF